MANYFQHLPKAYIIYGAIIVLLGIIFFIWLIRYFRIKGVTFDLGLLKTDLERKDVQSGNPIQFVSLEQLRQGLQRGGQVNWVDRKVTNIPQLRSYGRLIITGRMKLGKTREAIELVRRAVNEELVDSESIIKPSPLFSFISVTSIRKLIEVTGLNLEKTVLLFIDDLPFHYSGANLERLSELLSNLAMCKDVFVIATARSDQLREEHDKWLDSQRFFRIELPDLNEEQIGRIVDGGAGVFGLQIEDNARTTMIEGRDGTPELILMEMRRLSAERITDVTEAVAERIAKETIVESWGHVKRYIEAQQPTARYIFDSIAAFYTTKSVPYTYFILQYTEHLWKRKW